MQTRLPDDLLATAKGRRADAILRSCVHCGMCNAVCPTYQLLGDELDGPRGRIYLIKGLLEGGEAGSAGVHTVRTHLDRCLTCRGCEVACPSGVQYGELLEIGREVVEERGRRLPWDAAARHWLGRVAPQPQTFARWMGLGRWFRWLLPGPLGKMLPRGKDAGGVPVRSRAPQSEAVRRALILRGCVQRVATPAAHAAAERLLRANGIEAVAAHEEGCCGGLNLHLGQTGAALAAMRKNVDAMRPLLDDVEVIVSTASGCGVTVKDYGRLLADDGEYAADAARIAGMTRDLAEVAAPFSTLAAPGAFPAPAPPDGKEITKAPPNGKETKEAPPTARKQRRRRPTATETTKAPPDGKATTKVAWHAPCTLQHGQRVTGIVEELLTRAGFELVEVADAHLCCGSAGTYSLLQSRLAGELRDNKLANLMAGGPDIIATANVGCQTHLAAAAGVPVVHWAELLAKPDDPAP